MQHFTVGKEKFRVGDTITLRPPTVNENPFIGRIHEVRKTGKSLRLYVSWFYRPEEARGGRKGFHGEKELFQSDHFDWVTPSAVNGKCNVHSLKPDRVPVYCLCEMPFNPDLFMIECEGCEEWHHPECVHLTRDEVEKMAHFVCAECTKYHMKKGKHRARREGSDDPDGPSGKKRRTGRGE